MAAPSDAVMQEQIAKILESRDLTQTSLKEVRTALEQQLGLAPGALDEHKAKVKELATAEISRIQATAEGSASSDKPEAEADRQKKGKRPREEGKNTMARQSQCGLTRAEFKDKASGFTVEIGGRTVSVNPKLFSTGSCGFYGAQKVDIKVGGSTLSMQCQVNCAVIGSKNWED
eukprot:CAMPEP_0194484010 /NCGR_PEP_ID=MMETSP0253-20130528/5473_1 /TAXON_ID=2966 /ORGANISM="Noctiluca scintillans" /LENGTH=173 /DNA_ID=CAMNT_0039323753 /DNA_START=51 /DNA_END=572 /DNA_ORIENTATION=-